MGVDVEIYGSIVLILEELKNPERIVAKLKKWIKRHPDDVYGWKFDYGNISYCQKLHACVKFLFIIVTTEIKSIFRSKILKEEL